MQGAAAAVFTPLTMMTFVSSSESFFLLICHAIRRNLEEKFPHIKTALRSSSLKVCHALGVS